MKYYTLTEEGRVKYLVMRLRRIMDLVGDEKKVFDSLVNMDLDKKAVEERDWAIRGMGGLLRKGLVKECTDEDS